jgi:hypothetical protein
VPWNLTPNLIHFPHGEEGITCAVADEIINRWCPPFQYPRVLPLAIDIDLMISAALIRTPGPTLRRLPQWKIIAAVSSILGLWTSAPIYLAVCQAGQRRHGLYGPLGIVTEEQEEFCRKRLLDAYDRWSVGHPPPTIGDRSSSFEAFFRAG